MASPDPEIKEGFTLPTWIKSKPTKDFEPFAASPPAPEDAFFYIRYPAQDATLARQAPRRRPEPAREDTTAVSSAWKAEPPGAGRWGAAAAAACGDPVLEVAHHMMSRKFAVAAPGESSSEAGAEAGAEGGRHDPRRRGSRSLPVTPAHSPPGSPAARRRRHINRYFTSPFEPTEDASGRSWLTMALLGLKKDLASSTSTLAEEDAAEPRPARGRLAESVESIGPAPARGARPRPSELRELNFWSPTSM